MLTRSNGCRGATKENFNNKRNILLNLRFAYEKVYANCRCVSGKWGKWWQNVLGVLQQQHRKLKRRRRRRRQDVNKFSNYVTQQCLKKHSLFSFLLYQIVVVLPFGLPDAAAMLHNPNPTRSRVEP